jgi:hypothetical protein
VRTKVQSNLGRAMSSCSIFHAFHFLPFDVHKLSTFSHSFKGAGGAQDFIIQFSCASFQFFLKKK